MEKAELEELKDKVPCAAVLEHLGFALDLKESTRKAMKYRRDAAIIIVIHDGKGSFDPLSDGKGDVFRLVEHLQGLLCRGDERGGRSRWLRPRRAHLGAPIVGPRARSVHRRALGNAAQALARIGDLALPH